MDQFKKLAEMIAIASSRHVDQYDKGGKPYILHTLKVMHYLKSEDPELMQIAVGHDLIEDTFIDIDEGAEFLHRNGFSRRVIEGILALTKIPGEPYPEYKQRVKLNFDAVLVKMCDLRHNFDIRRIKGVSTKDLARMENYQFFYNELAAVLQAYMVDVIYNH